MKTIEKWPWYFAKWFLMYRSVIIVIRRTNGDDVHLRARLLELYACFVLNSRSDLMYEVIMFNYTYDM